MGGGEQRGSHLTLLLLLQILTLSPGSSAYDHSAGLGQFETSHPKTFPADNAPV